MDFDLDDITDVAFGVGMTLVDTETAVPGSVNVVCHFADNDGVVRELGRAYTVSEALLLGETIIGFAQATDLKARALAGDEAAAAELEEKGKEWEDEHRNDIWFN
jgi:hypothetical protein